MLDWRSQISAHGQSTPRLPILSLYESACIQQIEEAAIEMEWNGFKIDVPYFESQALVAENHQAECLARLSVACRVLGVESTSKTWTSGPQLIQLLHDDLHLPPSPFWFKGRVDLDKGERKVDRTALEWVHAHSSGKEREIVQGVMDLRRITASLKYLKKLPEYVAPDGFVHPVCGPAGDEDNRTGAITGRFGMKKPEAQQIPDKRKDAYHIRRGFVAPEGMLLVVRDYTALEVVIMANICEWLFGDTLLLDLTAEGNDIHAFNAHRVFGVELNQRTPSGRPIRDFETQSLYKSDPELAWYRNAIKAVWYKLQYGGTVHGFATSLRDQNGEPVGRSRAEEIVGALYEAVPSVPKWQAFVADILRRDGGICALDGRFVDYSGLIARGSGRKDDTDWAFQSAVRGAQNLPMQGTGAHIIGCAMVSSVNSPELRRLGALLELQVHDELRFRCPAGVAPAVSGLVDEVMRGAFPLKNLRTEGGIAQNWEDCK